MGYEKVVMDLDHCGAMLRMVAGMPVSDDTFSLEAPTLKPGPATIFCRRVTPSSTLSPPTSCPILLRLEPTKSGWKMVDVLQSSAPTTAEDAVGRLRSPRRPEN